MAKVIKQFSKLSKTNKIILSISIAVFLVLLTITIPTLANNKERTISTNENVWDGSIASSYAKGSGTSIDPFVISTGAELAYFSSRLEVEDYVDTYFILSNDILLNEGILKYNENDGVTYLLDGQKYYVDVITNNYYSSINKSGEVIGTLNEFIPIDGFKGVFSGESYTIHGIYIIDNDAFELGLFTNLGGSVKNIQIVNSLIYGGVITGGIASTANNAILNNILFDGFVVGSRIEQNKEITVNIPNHTLPIESTVTITNIDFIKSLPFIGGEIVSMSISGNGAIDNGPVGKMEILVNNQKIANIKNAFTIADLDIGTDVNNFYFSTLCPNSGGFTLTLTNLILKLKYNYAATGGIVGHSNNSTLTNVINKGEIIGKVTSGGIVGTATNNLSIEKSYNNGVVIGTYSGAGLVGIIEKSITSSITQSYNTGSSAPVTTKSGGLIGKAFNNDIINLNTVFNTANNYTLGTILHSNIIVSEGYYIYDNVIGEGVISGEFIKKTNDVLQAKDVLISMGFYEYISDDDIALNPENCWIYKDNEYPLLYTDNKIKPVANIYVGTYIFNDFHRNLSTKVMKNNITFKIETANIFQPIKEKYYYVTNSENILEESELNSITEWISAIEINQITVEGSYIIYVKVVDENDNIAYLNTDILELDLTKPEVRVTLGNEGSWTDLRFELQNIHLGSEMEILVDALDSMSGVKEVSYYVSGSVKTLEELTSIPANAWTLYEDKINTRNGNNIFYIKVIDNALNVTFVNTDYIIINGYVVNNVHVGRNSSNDETSITDKSIVSINLGYNATNTSDINNYNHRLVSNILLPKGTKITLYDYMTNKVYRYTITTSDDIYNYYSSCDVLDLTCENVARYSFTDFIEVGNINNLNFVESSYFNDGNIEENFKIMLDFSNTDIDTNYNDVKVYLELYNNSNEIIRPTISDTIETFDIIKNIAGNSSDAFINLSKNVSVGNLILNRDSYVEVDLRNELVYQYLDSKKIIDTSYEGKKMGLTLRLTDSEGNIIPKSYLDNMNVLVGSDIYTADHNGVFKIFLNGNIDSKDVVLKIETNEHETSLTAGLYYLKIASYASFDGFYEGSVYSNVVTIPVEVLNNTRVETHSFDLELDPMKHIVKKNTGEVKMTFDLLLEGNFTNPKIRVSMYEKKDRTTAYNQDYSIVDLQEYINGSLTLVSSKVYSVAIMDNFELNLNTNNFDYNGYKLVFDLYDGDTLVDSIKKYFLVN